MQNVLRSLKVLASELMREIEEEEWGPQLYGINGQRCDEFPHPFLLFQIIFTENPGLIFHITQTTKDFL